MEGVQKQGVAVAVNKGPVAVEQYMAETGTGGMQTRGEPAAG